MSGLTLLTVTHVVISLVGIVSGFVTLVSWVLNRRWERWTDVFLVTTIATSATGFLFPTERFLPSHAFGIISVVLLTVAVAARHGQNYAGRWRLAYLVGSLTALYLNFFVLIVQSFLKVPAFKALAPTQSELPFVLFQLTALLFFASAGVVAARTFRPHAVVTNRAAPGRDAVPVTTR